MDYKFKELNPEDPDNRVYLPDSYYEGKKDEYRVDLIKQFRDRGYRAGPTSVGNVWVERKPRDKSGKYKLFLSLENCMELPAHVVAAQVIQWAVGGLEPPAIIRLLTPEQQRKVIEVSRQAPEEGPTATEVVEAEFNKRADLRRQGFDPEKEGLK